MFLLKEKEFHLNIKNSLNQSDSLQNSMRKSNYPNSYLSDIKSPSIAFRNEGQLRGGDSFNSESSGSLHYMSKNLNAGTKL